MVRNIIHKNYITPLLIACIGIGILSSCMTDNEKRLHHALKLAGKNRVELDKVLKYYEKDTLKMKAAEYLIVNMPYHYALETYLLSPSGEKLIVDVDRFEERGKVYWYLDSLYKIGYQRRSEKHDDIKTLNAEFLIRNIDAAFRMWQKPWAKKVPFDIFCQWILPYRLQYESMPIALREKMIECYLPLLDSAKVTTPLEACRVINKRFAEKFRFKDMMSPLYPELETTLKNGYDACVGLCNLNIFIMRALGIPTTCDHTIWTHMNMGHMWGVVYDSGKTYPYDIDNISFTDYPAFLREEEVRRPAKVYRYLFDSTALNGGMGKDVTNDYWDKLHDLEIRIDVTEIPKESDPVYLCTYNCRRWMPLAIGKKEGGLCTFKGIAGNNFFIVADSPNGKDLRFITAPFYSDTTGVVKKLNPNKELISHTFPINDMKLYHYMYLNYWDVDSGKFVKINYDILTDTTRVYHHIPENSLMVFLIPKELPYSDRNRPVFYIDGDSICSTRSDLSKN